MEWIFLFAFLIVGVLAGFIGGLLGLSGGVITVPCLVLIFHFIGIPQSILMHTALGTSFAAMVLTGISSTWAHHRHQAVMWNIVLLMLPGIIVGCLLGSVVAHFLSGILLQMIFGIFICSLGAYVLLQKKRKPPSIAKPHKTIYSWLGIGIGSLSSLLGIGGGVFSVPLFISFQFSEKKAVGTSAAIGLFITFLAAMGYLYFGMNAKIFPGSLGYIYLPAFALVGLGTVLVAPLGAKIAHKMKGTNLRRVFASTLILIGILMIFN